VTTTVGLICRGFWSNSLGRLEISLQVSAEALSSPGTTVAPPSPGCPPSTLTLPLSDHLPLQEPKFPPRAPPPLEATWTHFHWMVGPPWVNGFQSRSLGALTWLRISISVALASPLDLQRPRDGETFPSLSGSDLGI
jgi:hypothetical protein